MLSTAVSMASFSVVLAETFAAVGLSTIIPAGVVTVARLTKELAAIPASDPNNTTDPNTIRRTSVEQSLDALTGSTNDQGVHTTPGSLGAAVPRQVTDVVQAISESLTTLHLLLPKTAKIRAEFEMSARDAYEVKGTVGIAVSTVVTVNAGFGMLYENTSRNKITLDVDFVSVEVPL